MRFGIASAQARGAGGVPKKIDWPEGTEALPNRDKALVVAELSGQGHAVRDLLEAAGLAKSSYYYALAHPQQPTRVQLRPKVAQIFSRTPNGCGHRQVAMCLRAEEGERIADKTVLKMMREMGLRCGIRRETNYHRYNSYKGPVGQSFANIIGRDFKDECFRGQDWQTFESFKADLATYITHWNTTRRHVKLKGLTRQNTGIRPYGKPHNGYH